MKYVVILADGMADYPLEELGGKTPIEVAKTRNMDYMAKLGTTGIVKTVPEGMAPGSDTANLSVLGYDPEIYYTGRSPLEAVSMGINLNPEDVTYRCNLVTLSDEENFCDKTMLDYSGGEITTEEAKELINALKEEFDTEEMKFYNGISYRNLLLWRKGELGTKLTPPHDITNKPIKEFLPNGAKGEALLDLMERANKVLENHPVNLMRIAEGKKPANACWFWGEGVKPQLKSFEEMTGKKGAIISAVDLIKGIGHCAGMGVIDVPEATGDKNTNYRKKGEAAVNALIDGYDFVFVHIEAPDECGHQGDLEGKIQAIQDIDREIVGGIMSALVQIGFKYKMMVLPDHPTPISLRTHVSDPVPFTIFDSRKKNFETGITEFSEEIGRNTGLVIEKGADLLPFFLKLNNKPKPGENSEVINVTAK